jgi:hypothetical protein
LINRVRTIWSKIPSAIASVNLMASTFPWSLGMGRENFPSATQVRPAASLPSTCTRASLAVSRTRQDTAGPSGFVGIPTSASKPSTVLPWTALPTSTASASLAVSVPCT